MLYIRKCSLLLIEYWRTYILAIFALTANVAKIQ